MFGSHSVAKIESFPKNVQTVAVYCFAQNLGPQDLLQMDYTQMQTVGERTGLDTGEVIRAVKWFSEYQTQQFEACLIRQCSPVPPGDIATSLGIDLSVVLEALGDGPTTSETQQEDPT